jgi:hypothetical protein
MEIIKAGSGRQEGRKAGKDKDRGTLIDADSH